MDEAENSGGIGTIGRQMARGTLWMVAMRWVIRLIGFVNTAIIARLLVPEDFGLVALAMVAVDLAITVTDGDIDMALIRSRDRDPRFGNTGWTLKILSGVVTAGLLFAAAPLAADFFGDARLTAIVRIAALKPAILGFENIGVIEFRRTLRFAMEFRYLVTQRLTSFALGLGLVFFFRDYLALAWFGPVAGLTTVLISYAIAASRPRLSLECWRELWDFSRWQMLFNAGRLLGERCDSVVVGALSSLGETGLYAVAFDLAMMPTREIMLPAGRALMPTYARIAADPADLQAAFTLVLGFSALVATSIGIGMSCIAEDAVLVVLGEQWRGAVPFVRWLGIFGALEGVWLMLDPYLIAARRERPLALANVMLALVMVPSVFLTAHGFGIGWIPAARIGVMAACLGAVLWRLVAWRWISPGRLLGVLWRPAAAAASMALVLRLAPSDRALAPLLSLGHHVALGALAYTGSLFLLWRLSGQPEGVERILADMVAARLPFLARRGR